jgi:hypothetical protein
MSILNSNKPKYQFVDKNYFKNSKFLLVQTQYLENYGDEFNPYFKFKGGCEYLVLVPEIFQDSTEAFYKKIVHNFVKNTKFTLEYPIKNYPLVVDIHYKSQEELDHEEYNKEFAIQEKYKKHVYVVDKSCAVSVGYVVN